MNFSFLNPPALWALPLALAPILLHLFFRRPPKTVEFGDLRLLARVAQKTRPRKKIRQWIILLLRFLSLFSLFFFFSKPVLHWGAASGDSGGAALVILLDHSYSMQASPVGLSRWDQALLDARKVLGSLKETDRSAMVLFSDQIDYDSRSLTNRHEDLISALQTFKPGLGNTQMLPALERGYGILANSAASNKSILILSDGARHGWSNFAKSDHEFSDWSASIANYDPSVRILMNEPVGRLSNLSIETVDPIAEAAGGLARYRVTLKNWGSKAVSRWPVSLETAEGARISETLTGFLPEERKSIILTAARSEGPSAIKAGLRSDNLKTDDSFFMTRNPREHIKVLVVEDYSGTAAISGETFFLRQALKSGPSPFEIQTMTLGQLKKTHLNGYRVIVLADPSEIDAESAAAIRQFIGSGGSLFISLGERFNPRSLAEIESLLPCRLGIKRETEGLKIQPSLGLSDEGTDANQYDLQKIEVRKSVDISLTPESSAWIYFADGTPLLAVSRDEKIALWASSIDRSWNNFASKPLYAPFLRALIETLASATGKAQNQGMIVGDVYQREIPDQTPLSSLVLTGPAGNAVSLSVQDGKIISPPLTEPGFYSLSKKSTPQKPIDRVAVNVDRKRREGDLSSVLLADCKEVLPKSQWIFLQNGERFMDDFIRVLRGKELTRAFALLAGLFLLGEMSLIYKRRS